MNFPAVVVLALGDRNRSLGPLAPLFWILYKMLLILMCCYISQLAHCFGSLCFITFVDDWLQLPSSCVIKIVMARLMFDMYRILIDSIKKFHEQVINFHGQDINFDYSFTNSVQMNEIYYYQFTMALTIYWWYQWINLHFINKLKFKIQDSALHNTNLNSTFCNS